MLITGVITVCFVTR